MTTSAADAMSTWQLGVKHSITKRSTRWGRWVVRMPSLPHRRRVHTARVLLSSPGRRGLGDGRPQGVYHVRKLAENSGPTWAVLRRPGGLFLACAPPWCVCPLRVRRVLPARPRRPSAVLLPRCRRLPPRVAPCTGRRAGRTRRGPVPGVPSRAAAVCRARRGASPWAIGCFQCVMGCHAVRGRGPRAAQCAAFFGVLRASRGRPGCPWGPGVQWGAHTTKPCPPKAVRTAGRHCAKRFAGACSGVSTRPPASPTVPGHGGSAAVPWG